MTMLLASPALPQRRSGKVLLLAGLCLAARVTHAQPPAITNIQAIAGGVSLEWAASGSHYIVAQSSDLVTGSFDYVGQVLDLNRATVTGALPTAFFRVREVTVVDVPDPVLHEEIAAAIVANKYDPPELIYDLDLTGITELRAGGLGISNGAGLGWCTGLTNLDLATNAIPALELAGCTNLQTLSCLDNRVTNLDVSACARLARLDCGLNALASLNLGHCPALTDLYCDYNQLTQLTVTGCAALEFIQCNDNHLSVLECSGLTNLVELICGNNQLTQLDLADCDRLTYVECWKNALAALDVSGLVNLSYLYCYENDLSDLNVAGCTNLVYLGCEDNSLKTLDVTGLSRLARLNCYVNFALTNLTLTGCTNLMALNCSSTWLSVLDISTCTSLTNVVCGRYITDLAPFVTNAAAGGLGVGDSVSFPWDNDLSAHARTNQLPLLTNTYHVSVGYY
jgi:hypothetical protein